MRSVPTSATPRRGENREAGATAAAALPLVVMVPVSVDTVHKHLGVASSSQNRGIQ